MSNPRRRKALLVATVSAATLTAGIVVTATAAQAAVGCRVTYEIGSQWPGGFTANVGLTNLGDPLPAWTVSWTFGAGQSVSQGWNAAFTQSGSTVQASNVSWNGNLAAGASASFGFNGSWTGSNPVPANFAVNGVTCTGAPPAPGRSFPRTRTNVRF